MLIALVLSIALHPIHLALVNLNCDSEKSTLDFKITFFADDLEYAVNNELGSVKLDILKSNSYEDQKVWVWRYLDKKVKLTSDGVDVHLEFVEYSIVDNRCIILITPSIVYEKQELILTVSALKEVYMDQRVLVQVNDDGEERSYLIDKNEVNVNISH